MVTSKHRLYPLYISIPIKGSRGVLLGLKVFASPPLGLGLFGDNCLRPQRFKVASFLQNSSTNSSMVEALLS